MVGDPYATLGVKKDASQADLQKAYRRLAKKHHPDLNPGNSSAEEKFKEITAAYDLLSDPEKRAKFDRGEIDASGTERPRQRYYRDFADQGGWSALALQAKNLSVPRSRRNVDIQIAAVGEDQRLSYPIDGIEEGEFEMIVKVLTTPAGTSGASEDFR